VCADAQHPGNATEIRLCGTEHLAAVQQILQAAPEAAPWSAGALADCLKDATARFLVATEGHAVVGFIIGHWIADEAEILNLAVQPEVRGRGIGTALVKALLEDAAFRGALRVFLEVRESNARAIRFYQRLGFRLTGCREEYYRFPVEAALVLTMEPSSQC